MGYFWSGLFFIIAAYIAAVVYLCRKRKDPVLVDWLEWVQVKRYFISIPLGIILLIFIWMLKSPLWATVGCQYDGHVRDVETKYDWLKKTCYFKTKSGTWMPLLMGRDSAEDKNHNQIPDSQEQQP